MTEPTQSLQVLLERAEAARDAALGMLHHQRMQAAAAQAQAEQLVAYRADYQRRWSEQFAQHGAIEIVRCYQGFMTRLEQAVAQQQRIAELGQAQAEAARAAVAACEMRVASVRKLIERRANEQQRVADRRDQKQTDEAAQRTAWQAAAARMTPLAT